MLPFPHAPSSDILEERETKAAQSRKTRPDWPLVFRTDDKPIPGETREPVDEVHIQKGGDPAAGSPTATLLRLHPSR